MGSDSETSHPVDGAGVASKALTSSLHNISQVENRGATRCWLGYSGEELTQGEARKASWKRWVSEQKSTNAKYLTSKDGVRTLFTNHAVCLKEQRSAGTAVCFNWTPGVVCQGDLGVTFAEHITAPAKPTTQGLSSLGRVPDMWGPRFSPFCYRKQRALGKMGSSFSPY